MPRTWRGATMAPLTKRTPGLLDRSDECASLRRLVDSARGGLGEALVVHGEVGIGKTALASRLAQDAAPFFERVYWRTVRDARPIRDRSAATAPSPPALPGPAELAERGSQR